MGHIAQRQVLNDDQAVAFSQSRREFMAGI
jgi:hypothetical protein